MFYVKDAVSNLYYSHTVRHPDGDEVVWVKREQFAWMSTSNERAQALCSHLADVEGCRCEVIEIKGR